MSAARAAPREAGAAARRVRDPRLDFFRGVAMFIIVISHTPGNAWTLWIPARFGFSDATEIFVFCSGMASAVAFGATFASHGWWIGAGRTLHRVWQVYWAHVGAFVVVAALAVALTEWGGTERDYIARLNLYPFFDNALAALPALLTLRYVPNYFDILPMYLVILAMLPLAIALARVHAGLVLLASLTLWLAVNLGQIRLSAAPWNDLRWFFNPFGWQLLFFTGFAFMTGWLRPPPIRPALVALAAGVALISLPLAWFRILDALPQLREAEIALRPFKDKTAFGPLRLVHFLALAYLAFVAAGPMGARLAQGRRWPQVVAVVQKVGQQSLAVFVAGLALSQLLGFAIDLAGRHPAGMALINLAGMGLVVAVAYAAAWFKDQPWRRPGGAPAPQDAAAGLPAAALER